MRRRVRAPILAAIALLVLVIPARVSFAQQISGISLPAAAHAVLMDAMSRSGVREAVVTRTRSSAADQVRIMYNFIVKYGTEAAFRMYGSEGDAVIEQFVSTDGSPDAKQKAMLEELNRRLPRARVTGQLMHVNDDLVVFDLSLRRLQPTHLAGDLIDALRADSQTVRVLGPEQGEKEAIHVELRKAGDED